MANFIRGKDRIMTVSAALRFPPLDPKETAVVVVDMLNWQVTRGKGFLRSAEKDSVPVD